MSRVSIPSQEWKKTVEEKKTVETENAEFFVPLEEAPVETSPKSVTPEPDENKKTKAGWIPSGIFSLSYIISLVIHLNLILLLAAFWVMQEKESESVGLISTIAEKEGDSKELDSLQVESLIETESQEEIAQESNIEVLETSNETSTQRVSPNSFKLSKRQKGSKNKGGFKTGRAGFFGSQAEGNSFVFIVDNSGSMNGPRFYRAINELKTAIEGLEKDQTFYVIFYNSVAVPMPVRRVRKLFRATKRNKKKAIKWINQQRPGGGTMPHEAVAIALKMKPQVIFFLTDGDMDRNVRTVFINNNKRSIKTVVHTIAFQFRGGEVILKGIAKDNKGRYRFIQ